jgi:hypothetical protein
MDDLMLGAIIAAAGFVVGWIARSLLEEDEQDDEESRWIG